MPDMLETDCETEVEELVVALCSSMGFDASPYDSDDYDIRDVLRDAAKHALCLRRLAENVGFEFDRFGSLTSTNYYRLLGYDPDESDPNATPLTRSDRQVRLESFITRIRATSFAVDRIGIPQLTSTEDSTRSSAMAAAILQPGRQWEFSPPTASDGTICGCDCLGYVHEATHLIGHDPAWCIVWWPYTVDNSGPFDSEAPDGRQPNA